MNLTFQAPEGGGRREKKDDDDEREDETKRGSAFVPSKELGNCGWRMGCVSYRKLIKHPGGPRVPLVTNIDSEITKRFFRTGDRSRV